MNRLLVKSSPVVPAATKSLLSRTKARRAKRSVVRPAIFQAIRCNYGHLVSFKVFCEESQAELLNVKREESFKITSITLNLRVLPSVHTAGSPTDWTSVTHADAIHRGRVFGAALWPGPFVHGRWCSERG